MFHTSSNIRTPEDTRVIAAYLERLSLDGEKAGLFIFKNYYSCFFLNLEHLMLQRWPTPAKSNPQKYKDI